ncbi:hypothetical protein CALVIDRAFT_559374 [Calocera viscosa TUFC12733]|uniref:DNA2/NAM7 helicase helicase domain-containing protein n=1 Tax=Calocera viscosa (strain TUFC12733) TaxID=1330018 RepID=A0A167S3Z0_CALVF|nr:hypothetical protein CALVIDRAFT_559374 [Calocera viscosa TUFC12733]
MPYIPHRPPTWRRDAPGSSHSAHDTPPHLDPNYQPRGKRGRASPTLSGGRASPAGRPDKRLRREDGSLREAERSWRDHNFPSLSANPRPRDDNVRHPAHSSRRDDWSWDNNARHPAPASRRDDWSRDNNVRHLAPGSNAVRQDDWSWGEPGPSRRPTPWERGGDADASPPKDDWWLVEPNDTDRAPEWPASPMREWDVPQSTSWADHIPQIAKAVDTRPMPGRPVDRAIFTNTAASVVDEDELLPPRSVTSPSRSVTSPSRSVTSPSRSIASPSPSSARSPSQSTERSRSTVRQKGKQQRKDPGSSLVNGVPIVANNDWGVDDGEWGRIGEEDEEEPFPMDTGNGSAELDWGDPDSGRWDGSAQEPEKDVVQEWEVTPVWEDGPVRDVEPENQADLDTGTPTPASGDTLANPSDLPNGVPKIVYNDVEKLGEVCNTTEQYIGIAAAFTDKARVSAVVLATSDIIVLVDISDKSKPEDLEAEQEARLRELLITILGRSKPTNIAVELGRQALCIHRDIGIHVNGVDLSSSLSGTTRMFYAPEQLALMAKGHPHQKSLTELGKVLGDRGNREEGPNAMTAAVAAALFAGLFTRGRDFELEKIVRMDTRQLLDEELELLGNMQLQTDVVEHVRPTTYEADFASWEITAAKSIMIVNARYATKIRSHMNVMITLGNGRLCPGKAVAVHGRKTLLEIQDNTILRDNAIIESILVVGGDSLSNPEVAKRDWMLSQLREPTRLANRSSIFRSVWFPTEADIKMLKESVACAADLADEDYDWDVKMDESQTNVAAIMCCPEYPLVLAHGPPGSGKTRTISAAVHKWTSLKQTSWLVCQSNIGVKNIAESLINNGFTQFKLLVSKEFYNSWHESVYTNVKNNLITLEDLPDKSEDLRYTLRHHPVMLCTLSMLSNPSLVARGLFNVLPVRNLVIDEASQIFVGDFAHLFYRLAGDLKKVCWFGDPYQLPPFGADHSEDLATVFDLPHLQENMHFLRTTYRVPFALNQFLSDEVYEGNLHSRFKPDRSTNVLKFVHVDGEETKVGTSWRNIKEAETMVSLVEKYYHATDYVILTPHARR